MLSKVKSLRIENRIMGVARSLLTTLVLGVTAIVATAVLVGILSDSVLWVVLIVATVVVIMDLSLTTRSLLAGDDN